MKVSCRKPYTKKITRLWWCKHPMYRFYILRESTALATVWLCFLLLYGLICLKKGNDSFMAFIHFLSHPLILLLNLLVLMAALLHTVTWFLLTPKAMQLTPHKERSLIIGFAATSVFVTIIVTAIFL